MLDLGAFKKTAYCAWPHILAVMTDLNRGEHPKRLINKPVAVTTNIQGVSGVFLREHS